MSTIFIVSGAFADPDIDTATAACSDDVFNSNTGPVNIEVNWEPNEINLRWYLDSESTTPMTVASESQTCTYDGTLTPPANIPTRTGYTFKGWRVRPTMNFSEIPTNVRGTNRWAIGWKDNGNYCWYDTSTGSAWNVACDSDNTYSQELQTYEWKVRYSHGDLYGMSGCSATNGSYGLSGNPTIGSGHYCWCKATGYKANGSSEIKGPLSALSWVFRDSQSVSGCASNCASNCSYRAEVDSSFRRALFAPAQ